MQYRDNVLIVYTRHLPMRVRGWVTGASRVGHGVGSQVGRWCVAGGSRVGCWWVAGGAGRSWVGRGRFAGGQRASSIIKPSRSPTTTTINHHKYGCLQTPDRPPLAAATGNVSLMPPEHHSKCYACALMACARPLAHAYLYFAALRLELTRRGFVPP